MKKRLSHIAAAALTASFLLSSISVGLPAAYAAGAAKTPVLPLTPFSVSGIGGAKAEIKKDKKLFIKTDTAVISSDTYLQGIIAEMPQKDTSVSKVLKVTPMTGGTALTYNAETVTHSFARVTNLTDEKGLKINTVTGKEYSVADTTVSQAYANIQFDKRNSFVGADGVMFYLKLDAANTVAPNFGAFRPENSGRWSFDFDPVLMLMVGKEYSYKALNASSWTAAKAVEDKAGNPYFGAMRFDRAFEGYVKIPFDSLSNDMGFKFKPNQDSLSRMCLKAKSLGGKYGTMTAGPYFVINKDSTSAKIEVNKSVFSAAPANVGAKISGFKLPLKNTDALLIYVKTDTANRITVSANMWDDYLSDIPSLVLKSNATVYTVALGGSKWTEQKTVKTETDGAVQFNKAFEGYIKIPVSSLKEQEASPLISVYPEIDYITGVDICMAGIGGKFGNTEAAAFLINGDKGTTAFELSDEYKEPEVGPVEVVPVLNTELLGYNWQWVKHTEVKPLDFTAAVGSKLESADSEMYEEASVGSSQAYANFKTDKLSAAGYEGMVFYVKFDSANTLMPQIAIDIPADKSRWSADYTPSLMLKNGGIYEYMPISGGEWKTAAAGAGAPGSTVFGTVSFDGAFEGYIKIPFSSLDNDSGFKFLINEDTICNIVYRIKGISGKYGEPVLGPSFLISKDGKKGIELKKADPITVNPVTDWSMGQSPAETFKVYDTPLKWTAARGQKISADHEYTKDFATESLAYARYQMNGSLVFGNATHVIMYLKTDTANTVVPRISYVGSSLGIGYDPEMALGVGKAYSYLPAGGTKWLSGTAVQTWSAAGGNTYFGGIKFDKAFEGYVKFAIADLCNDYALVNNADRKTTEISGITVSIGKIGGKYGTVTAGPFFLTEKDSDSTEIKLYEKPAENTDVAITASPIDAAAKSDTLKFESVTPFKGLTLTAYKFSLTGKKDAFSLNGNTALKGSNGFLFYAKASRETVIVPALSVGGKPELGLTSGKKYGILSFGDSEWNFKVITDGGITLKAGFEGYISLPHTAFASDSGFEVKSGEDAFKSLAFGFGNTENGGSVTLGALSLITNNGGSTEVIYPTAYDSKDPYERIQGIFERTKQGLAHGNYYMVGDSTRHIYGYPIFRIVRNALKEKYDMNCVVQAQSGLKAEHWSNYTPGLDGPTQPTVDQLIEKIPGNGRNCIVDIALGINDSGKSGDEIYKYLKKGIDEIRKAKPEAVIVYTSPSLVSFSENNDNMRAAAKKIWEDSSIYKIDVMNNVFDDYYSQYYSDTHHPNSLGYKLIGQYIVSKYLGTSFDKIYDVDTSSYTLPTGASPITSSLKISLIHNLTAGLYSMKVNGKNVSSVKLNGSVICSGNPPFDTDNFIETRLSEPLNGNDYIAFYLKLPSANSLGVRAFGLKDNREIIFKGAADYYICPLGSDKWTEKTTSDGLKSGNKTYGSIDFDGAFEGWVKLPLSGFFNSPSVYEDINGVTFRFSEIGGDYGEVRVGAFFAISDEPYTVKNMWKKSDLPEMTPFTPITALDSSWLVYKDYLPSPIPSLSKNKCVVIGSEPAADYDAPEYAHSAHWVSAAYNNMPLAGFSHLLFYVKVPTKKENRFTMNMVTDKRQFDIMANMSYQLLAVGEKKWKHYPAERTFNSIGGVVLPAGFEGLVKIPVASLLPTNATEDVLLQKVFWRFAYIGMGDNMVTVGPMFGVTKDNDTGPDEVVYTSLPEATTIKSIYAIEKQDIFTDKVMLYWEAFEGAKYYMAEAYSITKTETGYEYRLVAQNKAISNSGAITDLMPGRKYAVLIKAYDLRDKLLAIYDYTTFTTLETEQYVYPTISNNMTYDKVYYKQSVSDKTGGGSYTLPIVIGGVSVALLAGAAAVFTVVYKRRKKK